MPKLATEPFIIAVDDEAAARSEIKAQAMLARLGTVECDRPEDANAEIDRLIDTGQLVGVVADLSFQTANLGWEVIKHAYSKSPSLDLIVFTGYPKETIPIQVGEPNPSFTMIPKGGPDASRALRKRLESIRAKWDKAHELVYDQPTRRLYKEVAAAYAKSSLPVLILGETGSGKESLAQEISETSGRPGRIVPVNCGGLEPSLAFSELFGHAAGAFTGAENHVLGKMLEASGYLPGKTKSNDFREWLKDGNPDIEEVDGLLDSEGAKARARTLFLDEVAALPRSVMPGLLRVLETQDVSPFGYHGIAIRSHCRIISATNEVAMLKDARFRKDLFYRLAGSVLTLPPLRERDPGVIREYIQSAVWVKLQMTSMEVKPAAVQRVIELYRDRADETAREYQAGNFRTLRHLIHRAALLAKAQGSAAIDVPHIDVAVRDGEIRTPQGDPPDQQTHIRAIFRNALDECGVSDVRQDFGLDDLKEWSSHMPVNAAYAFLCCNLIPRTPSSKRGKYYELKEIETALARGYGRGSWINSSLKAEDVIEAAYKYFGLPRDGFAGDKINEIVKKVQKNKSSVT